VATCPDYCDCAECSRSERRGAWLCLLLFLFMPVWLPLFMLFCAWVTQ
jgi:hypothetical protein